MKNIRLLGEITDLIFLVFLGDSSSNLGELNNSLTCRTYQRGIVVIIMKNLSCITSAGKQTIRYGIDICKIQHNQFTVSTFAPVCCILRSDADITNEVIVGYFSQNITNLICTLQHILIVIKTLNELAYCYQSIFSALIDFDYIRLQFIAVFELALIINMTVGVQCKFKCQIINLNTHSIGSFTQQSEIDPYIRQMIFQKSHNDLALLVIIQIISSCGSLDLHE